MESLLKGLARIALRTARPGIRDASRTLAKSAVARYLGSIGDVHVSQVHIPHYWAVFVHDGHDGIQPVRRRFLVYYLDPRRDPRRSGGRSTTPEGERSLTKAEFRTLAKQIYDAKKAGRKPPARIVEDSGPALGSPFFDNTRGMAAFESLAKSYIDTRITNYMKRELRNLIRFDATESRALRISF